MTLANTALTAKVKKLEDSISKIQVEKNHLEKQLRDLQSSTESGLNSVAEKSKVIQSLKSELGDLNE